MERYLKDKHTNQYIDGMSLLALCQKIQLQISNLPEMNGRLIGEGTPSNPYIMSKPMDWIANLNSLQNHINKKLYYKLSGRLISKDQNMYISDVGPSYLQKSTNLDSAQATLPHRFEEEVAPQFIGAKKNKFAGMSDRQISWVRSNSLQNMSYRKYAKRIYRPELIHRTDKQLRAQLAYQKEHEKVNSSLIGLDNSRLITATIRNILSGNLVSTIQGFHRHYARFQQLLPSLTATMFFAEPARNQRAWPINLMLLDLAETSQDYSFEKLLWHPLAVDKHGKNEIPEGVTIYGPEIKNDEKKKVPKQARKIIEIKESSDLHHVGGLLPSSPTNGGFIGKPSLIQKQKFSYINIQYDYIHQKEINVLFDWLLSFPNFNQTWERSHNYLKGNLISPYKVIKYEEEDYELHDFYSFILDRCLSFQSML
jgi:hypothetical protein